METGKENLTTLRLSRLCSPWKQKKTAHQPKNKIIATQVNADKQLVYSQMQNSVHLKTPVPAQIKPTLPTMLPMPSEFKLGAEEKRHKPSKKKNTQSNNRNSTQSGQSRRGLKNLRLTL
jgi:hypothetical protein